jgi:hypothetical protein
MQPPGGIHISTMMTFWEWLGQGYQFGFVQELQRLFREGGRRRAAGSFCRRRPPSRGRMRCVSTAPDKRASARPRSPGHWKRRRNSGPWDQPLKSSSLPLRCGPRPDEHGADAEPQAQATHAGLAGHLRRTRGIAAGKSPMPAFCVRHGTRPYRPTYRSLRGDPAGRPGHAQGWPS